MKSKVFGIGLSRTGTTSLNNFLIDIGYNVRHYPTQGELFEWDNDGGTDLPVVYHFKQLDKYWPNSKFIFTTRDKNKWLESIVPYFQRKRDWNQSGVQVEIRKSIYGSAFPNVSEAEKAWEKHCYDVYKYFENRPNDLIKIDIVGGDSPQELLKFLGKDENLRKSFPHSNKLNRK